MISVEKYFTIFKDNNIEYFTGVPDSSLKNFVSYVADNIAKKNHVIAANEGASVAIAAGYHLATNKIPVVYLQNSGLGNAINPLLSLADKEVYKIPMLLLIGWRGEPNIKDEPQHIKQGKVTLSLLHSMGIPYEIIDDNEGNSLFKTRGLINRIKMTGIPHAVVVRKGVFTNYNLKHRVQGEFQLSREAALKIVVDKLQDDDVVISTTGKLSRELFEYRELKGVGHEKDFLTVGSMGHASSIAYGIAKEKPGRNVYCFDGDGALLMHAGSLSNIGKSRLPNLKHIVFNNGAHESVGGQETMGFYVNLPGIAEACGYTQVNSVNRCEDIEQALIKMASSKCSSFLEIKVGINSRKDLGRPTITPIQNKNAFMSNLNE